MTQSSGPIRIPLKWRRPNANLQMAWPSAHAGCSQEFVHLDPGLATWDLDLQRLWSQSTSTNWEIIVGCYDDVVCCQPLNFETTCPVSSIYSKPSSRVHQLKGCESSTFGDRALRPGTGSPRISRTRIRGCQAKGSPTWQLKIDNNVWSKNAWHKYYKFIQFQVTR